MCIRDRLTAYCTALAVGCAAAMFPGELDVPAYLVVNAGLLCLHLALGGFCFFASCLFNESRLSVALGAGVPVLFFLLSLIHIFTAANVPAGITDTFGPSASTAACASTSICS